MTPRRILLTGANGLVGQALGARLGSREDCVLTLTGRQPEARAPLERSVYLQADLAAGGEISRLLAHSTPHVVVHCGAMSQVDRCELERASCWRVNVECVEGIARWCRSRGARLVHISTDFVFDGEKGLYREDDPVAPVNFYGESKVASERVVRECGPEDRAIVRTVLVWGKARALGRSNIATWVLDSLRRGERIRVVQDQWRTPTCVDDLAWALERLALGDSRGVFHAAGDEYLSVFDFARRIAEFFGLDASRIEPVSSEELAQPARRPPRTGLCIDRAHAELGYRPRSIEDALRKLAT